MSAELDPRGLAAARRYAQWYIGDRYWADRILSAYFHPDEANAVIDEEQES